MKCTNCSNIDDKVIESRSIAGGISVRRRRECLNCGYRFTSYEHIEEKKLMVIKRDKRRELFNIEKLSNGIQKAFEKRPIPQNSIEKIINDIEEEAILLAGDKHEIPSYELGEMVMNKVKSLDSVAFIRFASVYKKFEDINEFIKEIESIKKG